MSSVYVTNCTPKSKPTIFPSDFKVVRVWDEGSYNEETTWAYNAGHHGYISIVSRRTGFGWRDVETGFRNTYAMNARGKENYGKNFWLASGNFDISQHIPSNGLCLTEAIRLIKQHANNCIGIEE